METDWCVQSSSQNQTTEEPSYQYHIFMINTAVKQTLKKQAGKYRITPFQFFVLSLSTKRKILPKPVSETGLVFDAYYM